LNRGYENRNLGIFREINLNVSVRNNVSSDDSGIVSPQEKVVLMSMTESNHGGMNLSFLSINDMVIL